MSECPGCHFVNRNHTPECKRNSVERQEVKTIEHPATPPQTFEEWWHENGSIFVNGWRKHAAEAAWNAAKGVKI